ncbi:geranylgeranylglyceryl/heptaprenylglyceryl phosphate synthase [Aeropyrum camini]|uniref:Geranylgeranylglyceryl phosphate synthase n=1 Tax=Aeropyrum camini SY1 = JCM 12091 TaxID=1198449 RepID=U3T8T9_9CREN|nr:geranylgeranylglyceryl/heptaprenylglyceryl phosphate synthase [Aeropyrum camini]BAN89942.1 geranylgeranylglyceryl phosphate synthase [Aeropyrum camini SY1 = JCM 12091]
MAGRRLLEKLLEKRRSSGRLHFTLIDPDKTGPAEAGEIAARAAEAGSDAVLVGGSIGVTFEETDEVVKAAKTSGLPVILFPGGHTNASRHADAVLFLTVLNSDNPYYIVQAQILGAPLALKLGLEAIPTSYIIVGYGGAAGFVARARPIPYEKPELAALHALAGAMMGGRIVYLEAGSGAPKPVPPEAVAASRKLIDAAGYRGEVLLTVGGGVRTPEAARAAAEAGADVLVTGTLAEENPERLAEIVKAFKSGSPT